MKLIRKLPARLNKSKNSWQSWAIFLCPCCLQEVGRIVQNGEKAKSCGCQLYSKEHRQEMSIANKGKNNPNWQNGKSFEEYGKEFNKEFKQFIYKRDSYCCQNPDCEYKTNILDAHHIDYNKKNNISENVITLCRSCHSKTNGKKRRQYFTEYYQNIIKNG